MSVGYEYEDCHCHPWCSDPSRDEAVRASEDGRSGPLPTLEEAISAVTERRPPEPGGGGNVTGGLRTERVSLSLARMGELIDERDAAIRERDALRARVADLERAYSAECDALAQAHRELSDLAEAVRERESGEECDHSYAAQCREAAAARDRADRMMPAPDASGAAGTEPDAWGVWRDGSVESVAHRRFRNSAEHSAEHLGGTVVPLYAVPQAAKGWLTEKERHWINYCRNNYPIPYAALACFDTLLARSSPPEVVHPECVFDEFSGCSAVHAWNICAADFRKALAAAGVKVKEVGK